jgi:hypothetical protein
MMSSVSPIRSPFSNLPNAGRQMPAPAQVNQSSPLADASFSPTGTPEAAMGLDLDSQGNLLRMGFDGRYKVGAVNPQGQYWLINGQQGDIFETRNPAKEGILEIPLSNQSHPFIQLLRKWEQQRAIVGSEIPQLRASFNRLGLNGQGVKIGVLDPYEPLDTGNMPIKTAEGEPGQAWVMSDHSKVIANMIKDPKWGLAPGAEILDCGFTTNADLSLGDEDDISVVQYNMSKTASNLLNETSQKLDELQQKKRPGLRVLSMTWGGSMLTTLDRLTEDLNTQKENGEYLYPNVRRQILGPALFQGPVQQEQAMLNFIAQVFQHPSVQQARQGYIAATQRATANGLIPVVAAGNEHGQTSKGVIVPPGAEFDELAKSPYVIAVGASDTHLTPNNRADDSIANFSSWGDSRQFSPTVVAPGQCIFVNGKYETMNSNQVESGTSFAVPYVCSVIAMMLQINPALTFEQVKAILQRAATPVPGVPMAAQGAGVLNAEMAAQLAKASLKPH